MPWRNGHEVYLMEWDALFRILLLQDHNTRVVVLGTFVLGVAAGLAGSLLLLRKRALLSDTLAHASLPGVGMMYLVLVGSGQSGRQLLALLGGAVVACMAAVLTINLLKQTTRLKEDALLSMVLSVYFGLGVVLLGIITRNHPEQSAGLQKFLYGSTAALISSDAWLLVGVAAGIIVLVACFWKEFQLLLFDSGFAASEGYPVQRLDLLVMLMVVLVTVCGMQAVGLILVVALLVIPPVAARFWSEEFLVMQWIAAFIGGVSCALGTLISGVLPNMPAGAVIVLTAALLFFLSMILGIKRGILLREYNAFKLRRKTEHHHALRALYELLERHGGEGSIAFEELRRSRSWSAQNLKRTLRRAVNLGLIEWLEQGVRLSPTGREEARKLVRSHRLWELYLITYADVAPSRVDRSADDIEHVLEPALVALLEEKLLERNALEVVPKSPHGTNLEPVKGGV
jgi:manganese/zinc/iron transport system permease protein